MREAAVEPDGDGVTETESPLVGDTLGDTGDGERLGVTLADAICDGDGDSDADGETLAEGGDGATVPPQPSG